MTRPTCAAGCGRPAPGAFLCRACTSELEQAIAELPAGLRDLQAVAYGLARGPLGLGDPARSCERGPGDDDPWTQPGEATEDALGGAPWEFAPGAADLLWAATNTLTTWIRHLCESRGVPSPSIDGHWDGDAFTPYASQPIDPLCTWLVANIDAIRQDEAAAQIHDEINSLRRAIEAAVLGRPQLTEFHGLCDKPDVVVEINGDTLRPVVGKCDAQIWSAPGAEPIDCPACGASYTRAERCSAMLTQLTDTLATVRQAAVVLTDLGVSVTINQVGHWRRRGLVETRGVDQNGHLLVRFGDVHDQWLAMTEKVATRRKRRAA